MIKKILLFALVMFPVMSFAQEAQKIAHANYAELVTSMPEYKLMVDSLQRLVRGQQAELQRIQDTYYKEVSDFVAQQDSISESIKNRRRQDIESIRERGEIYQQEAAQEQTEAEQALFAPIQRKVLNAIIEVGAENNFLYILNSQPEQMSILFFSKNAVDAAPLIKKKLGIQ